MNRIALAAVLASAGFAAAATAQTAPPPGPLDGADRVITRDEAMAKADQRFDRMDLNRDGKIDAGELTARRQPAAAAGAMPPPPPPTAGAALPAPPPMRDGSRMLARLDANGDGAIDRAEFRAREMQRFDRVDANKDGKLDAAERQAARDAMGMRRGQRAGGDMPPPPPPQPDAGQ